MAAKKNKGQATKSSQRSRSKQSGSRKKKPKRRGPIDHLAASGLLDPIDLEPLDDGSGAGGPDGVVRPRAIIDLDDDRRPVSNIREVPYKWVCQIYGKLGKNYKVGTGTLISRNAVLTVAHNLWMSNSNGDNVDPANRIQKLDVYFELEGSRPAARHVRVAKTVPYGPYLQTVSSLNDVAILILDDPLPASYQFAPLNRVTPGQLSGWRGLVCGFPMKTPKNQPGPTPAATAWYDTGELRDRHGMIRYELDTTSGQSGGPLFVLRSSDNRSVVVGMHTAGSPHENFSVPIYKPVADFIDATLQAYPV